MRINIKMLEHAYAEPIYAHHGDAGADLYAANDKTITLKPGMRKAVPTGVCIELPEGYEAQIRPRSSGVLNTDIIYEVGTVDSTYRGEVMIIVRNYSSKSCTIRRGDRLAQMVVAPVVTAAFRQVQALSETSRGDGGIGSTG